MDNTYNIINYGKAIYLVSKPISLTDLDIVTKSCLMKKHVSLVLASDLEGSTTWQLDSSVRVSRNNPGPI